MSPDRDALTPAETRARDAVRDLPRPPADAAFRARLRRDFAAGTIGERRALVLPAARPQGLGWRLAMAAVAALLLVAGVMLANRGANWTVLATIGDGVVVVDGRPIPLGHHEDLIAQLRPGARVVVPDGAEVELGTAAGMIVQVTAGTEFTLPASPGRWFRREVAGRVGHGEIRLTTGPAFRGARLRVETPEATVQVTGTTLAVICEPAGTCVCVLDGAVRVGGRSVAMEAVQAGRRRYVFNDGRPPESAEIRAMEIGKLGAFRDRRRAWFQRER